MKLLLLILLLTSACSDKSELKIYTIGPLECMTVEEFNCIGYQCRVEGSTWYDSKMRITMKSTALLRGDEVCKYKQIWKESSWFFWSLPDREKEEFYGR